ncbi:MAG: AI-2E family transporter [Elusimicrobia bacterium]|nr:AI-2E family transporter [Elusimicrobiota bacterium]
MTLPAKISYILVALLITLVMVFHLGHVVLAALFAFMFMEVLFRLFKPYMPKLAARWLAMLGFLSIAAFLGFIFATFIKQTLFTIPSIVEAALPRVLEIAGKYSVSLPFESFQDLRDIANSKLLLNAMTITKASTYLTREVFHMVLGISVSVFFFLAAKAPEYKSNLFDAVRKETNARIRKFMYSFHKVLGGQLVISAINAMLTALFLYLVGMPHLAFLTVMTFVIGIMPIIGNIVSNTVIVITALGISLQIAGLALAFLIVIHKLEYFLNSRIMGASINMPMWQTLLSILVGSIVMGFAGIMLAPAILHYIKSELQAIPLEKPLTSHPQDACPG